MVGHEVLISMLAAMKGGRQQAIRSDLIGRHQGGEAAGCEDCGDRAG